MAEDIDVDGPRRALEARRGPHGSAGKPLETKRSGRATWLGSLLGEVVVIIVIALVISSVLRAFVFQMFEIPSGSMEDTLQVRDRVASVKLVDYDQGDIVVFRDPANWLGPPMQSQNPVRRLFEYIGVLPSSSTSHLIKRVVGLPGDKVECCTEGGRIIVNGHPLDETSYLFTDRDGRQVAPSDLRFSVTVPKDRLFVLGDHRDASGDSRIHLCDASKDAMPPGMTAFVPVTDVVGPAKAIVAPLNRIQTLGTPETYASVPDPGPAPDAPRINVNGADCPS